jgi:hypothetical protein
MGQQLGLQLFSPSTTHFGTSTPTMMDVLPVSTDQPTIDPLSPPKAVNKGEELPSDEVKSRPAPVFAPTREAPSPGDCAPPAMTKGIAPSASSLANDNMLPGISTAVSADDSPVETTYAPRVSNSPVEAGDVHQPSASSNTATRSESGAPHSNANNDTSSILSSLASSEDSVMDKNYPNGGSVASWGGQISPPKAHHGTMHHTTVAETETAFAPKYTMPEDHLSLSMMGRNMMNNIYGVPTSSAPFIVNNAENNLSMLEGTMMRHIHGISTTSAATAPSSETNAEKKTEPAVSQAKKHEAEEVASEEVSEPPKKKKKKKKAKDPNAPVRPKTGYMFYSCNGARTAVKEAYPDLTFGEVTKVVAANWNAMSDEKKEVWNRMAADDRERYQREMDAYKGSELEAQWLASLEEDATEEAKWVTELKAAEEAKWAAELRVAQEEAKVAEAKAREEAAVKELAEAKAREEAVVKKKMEWLTSLETQQETDMDEVQEEAVQEEAVEEEEESGELLLNISPGKLGLKIKMDEVLGGVVIVKVLKECTFKDLVGAGWRIITIDDVPVKSTEDFSFKEGEIEKNRLMKFVKP